jgi:hypothetical protein
VKLNKGGLVLSGIYAAISLPLFAVAFLSFSNDVKGQVVFGQLAAAPVMMLLTYTGLIGPLTKAFPWMNNFYAFFALSLLIMYLIGWGLSRLARLN